MARLSISLRSTRCRFREFFFNALVAFGVVTILRAVMVPPALFHVSAPQGAAG